MSRKTRLREDLGVKEQSLSATPYMSERRKSVFSEFQMRVGKEEVSETGPYIDEKMGSLQGLRPISSDNRERLLRARSVWMVKGEGFDNRNLWKCRD